MTEEEYFHKALAGLRDVLEQRSPSKVDAYLQGWADSSRTYERLAHVCVLFTWLKGCVLIVSQARDLTYERMCNHTMQIVNDALTSEGVRMRQGIKRAVAVLGMPRGEGHAERVCLAVDGILEEVLHPVDNSGLEGAE